MCGIAGYVSRDRYADMQIVERQLATLVHRGPDSVGAHVSGRAALGQTRLSIIDLVSGDPPITAAGGTVGVALNGEIYNFADLRTQLRLRGHDFQTSGDTEVLAHLGEETSGGELARPLHGMFAFAVHDARRDVLTIGRDRLGEKPLYYYLDDRRFVFGSEIKAVLAHPDVPRSLDEQSIPSYLTLGAPGTPYTMFEGIRQLPPGCTLTIDSDFEVRIEPYWELQVPGAHPVERLRSTFAESTRLVRDGLEHAVRRRLVADVPLGAFLSGGVDSSLIVALMAANVPDRVRTFTIGFEDDDGFDERDHARLVAQRFDTDHHEFVVRPDAIDLIERLVHHHDEPFGDSSAIPTYLLSEMTRQHVKVALSGDGGDELFAGYERFAAGVVADYAQRVPDPVRDRLIRAAAGAFDRRGRSATKVTRFLGGLGRGYPDAYRAWISYVQPEWVQALTGQNTVDGPGLAAYTSVFMQSAGASPLDRLLYLNARTYLPDDLLVKVDRTSMAHGLEVRSPFLDHELVELAFRLPAAHKLRGRTLKRVLKAAARSLVPDEILDRPKHGFGVPLDRWIRTDLKAYVEDRLSATSRVAEHLRWPAVEQLVAEHQSGKNHGHAIWTLLTLEEFLRREGW